MLPDDCQPPCGYDLTEEVLDSQKSIRSATAAGVAAASLTGATPASAGGHHHPGMSLAFDRVATYPVFQNRPAGEDPTTATVAEISAVSEDGRTLIHTDALARRIGFLDISRADQPRGLGTLSLAQLGNAEDEPTSVARGRQLRARGRRTRSASYTEPSGRLDVIELASHRAGGQLRSGGAARLDRDQH